MPKIENILEYRDILFKELEKIEEVYLIRNVEVLKK